MWVMIALLTFSVDEYFGASAIGSNEYAVGVNLGF